MPEHTKDKQTRKDSGQQIFYDGLKIKCGHWNTQFLSLILSNPISRQSEEPIGMSAKANIKRQV